jgi:N-acetylmuramoyl-L-alanine amidase
MYNITKKYIANPLARPERKLNEGVKFIVAHDTGNAGATAMNHYHYFQSINFQSSAQVFIDDQYILEIIPINEKAWHVRYDKDTRLLGLGYANDNAIGVELCFGGSINFQEAYKRYVWYMAYLCKKFNRDPRAHIIGHYKLDPQRKTDPINAFKRYGVTWDTFIDDVAKEFYGEPPKQTKKETPKPKEEKFVLEQAIIFNSSADFASVESLINKTGAPAYTRTKAEQLGEVAKEIIIVGGGKGKLKAKKFTDLSGKNRFETAAKVADYLK